ncbi:MAG: hypothetical protein ACRCYY_18945 [Trueperaceae bacterium]
MTKKQQIALGINFLGVVLFLVWLFVRNSLPGILSLVFAVIFLGLLALSLVLLIRAAKVTNEETER